MAADDHLSVQQFGMKGPLSWQVGGGLNHVLKKRGLYPPPEHTQTRMLGLDRLRAMQEHVFPGGMLHKQSGPHLGLDEEHENRPLVIGVNGENVIWNGTHRIAKAVKRGQKSGIVDYIHVGHVDPEEDLKDWVP